MSTKIGEIFMLHPLVFFTLKAAILPVLGVRFNRITTLFIMGVYLLFHRTSCMYVLTWGMPTLIAFCAWSLYTHTQHTNTQANTLVIKIFSCLLHAILPLSCFTLFIMHPIGSHALLYACYWLIPPVIYCVKLYKLHDNIFLEALGITFITHAVGSIIWLYAVPMAAEQWLTLIPIVIIERLLFALVSAGAYRVVDFIIGHFKLYTIKITTRY